MRPRTGWTAWGVLALVVLLSGPAEAAKRVVSGVVNLNTASVAQLDELPGVGEKAALRIIERRRKVGFKRIEEIVKVKGFGKKKFDKLKAHLSVDGPNTLTSSRAPAGERKQGRRP